MSGRRKPVAIDLLKLYCEGNSSEWNIYLANALRKRDINGLAETRKRLQAGMDLLAKDGLNSDKICLLFIRLQNSLEATMKQILRLKNPNPCDDPLKAKDWLHKKGDKKLRDESFERFLKKTGY